LGSHLLRPHLPSRSTKDELLKPGPLGDKILGDENAPVTIVEYASMTCGHCANFHKRTWPDLKKDYIETGKVRFIFREFPLDQRSPRPPSCWPAARRGQIFRHCRHHVRTARSGRFTDEFLPALLKPSPNRSDLHRSPLRSA
jgi:hypothetical protein